MSRIRNSVDLAALSAVLMLALTADGVRGTVTLARRGVLRASVGVVAAVRLGITISSVPALLVGYGRYAPTYVGSDYIDFVYVGEGMNSSMAVSVLSNGDRNYHNAGKVQASSEPQVSSTCTVVDLLGCTP